MSEERITLAPGEGLPGFPSGHGPGDYLVDFEARTIRPAPLLAAEEAALEANPQENEAQDEPLDGQSIEEG